MATQFVPVEMPNIEQGKFLDECNEAFAELQRDFVSHIEEHGVSAAASLSMSIKINYDKAKMGYAIVTDINSKLPKKPSGVTTAFVAEDEKGERTLFTQFAGTGKGNPRQGRLQTTDGETVS